VVRVELTEEGESDSVLRFSVRDTGIGIGKDKIGVLFEKFSQVEVSTTRKYGGTGLGLAISKQLVEMMGGHVGVMSEEGRGSEFWFTVRLGRSVRWKQRPKERTRKLKRLRVSMGASWLPRIIPPTARWLWDPAEAWIARRRGV